MGDAAAALAVELTWYHGTHCQAAWWSAACTAIDAAAMRADRRDGLLAVARVLRDWADWQMGTTAPGWKELLERTGLSRATVARSVAWLHDAGLLATAEAGTIGRWRPHWSRLTGRRRAVYVLTAPRRRPAPAATSDNAISDTPSVGTTSSTYRSPTRAREAARHQRGDHYSWVKEARTKAERLAMAEELRATSPDLRRLSAPHLAYLLRPETHAGLTLREIVWRIDREPSGASRIHTEAVRFPAGWLRHRLAPWRQPATDSGPRGHDLEAVPPVLSALPHDAPCPAPSVVPPMPEGAVTPQGRSHQTTRLLASARAQLAQAARAVRARDHVEGSIWDYPARPA